jgi:hypothetical protein
VKGKSMSQIKSNRASEAFYDRVEAELKKLNLSSQISREESVSVDDFAALDFGAGPCAAYIQTERAKKQTGKI